MPMPAATPIPAAASTTSAMKAGLFEKGLAARRAGEASWSPSGTTGRAVIVASASKCGVGSGLSGSPPVWITIRLLSAI
jgi:hypothetical protein